MFLANLNKLAQFVNPLTSPPWKDAQGRRMAPITKEEVEAATPKFHGNYDGGLVYSRAFHLERIAHYYREGVNREDMAINTRKNPHDANPAGHPLEILAYPLVNGGYWVSLQEGDDHLLAAALLKGEEMILAQANTETAAKLFGA